MQQKSVAIIDYDMGNVWSVLSALRFLGADAELVSEPDSLSMYQYIILPGVGSFRKAMEVLHARGMVTAIREQAAMGKFVLGICLGMQLLGRDSTEDGLTEGIGLIDNAIRHFDFPDNSALKVPHVGFNDITISQPEGIFKGLSDKADFYFTHSYRMLIDDFNGNAATCCHGETFMAAFEKDNVMGAQFHPEKSQTNGLVMLKNFLEK